MKSEAFAPISEWRFLSYGKAPFTNANIRKNGEHFALEPSYRFLADLKLAELQKKVRHKMRWLRDKVEQKGWKRADSRRFQPDQLLRAILSDLDEAEDFGLPHDRFYIRDRLLEIVEAERTVILSRVNARWGLDFSEKSETDSSAPSVLKATITKESLNRRFDPENPDHLHELRSRMEEAVRAFQQLSWERGSYTEKVLENELARPNAVSRSRLFSRRDLIAMLCLCGFIESVPTHKKGDKQKADAFKKGEQAEIPALETLTQHARGYFSRS